MAQADALALGGAADIELVELEEDLVQLIGRYAATAVPHLQFDEGATRPRAEQHAQAMERLRLQADQREAEAARMKLQTSQTLQRLEAARSPAPATPPATAYAPRPTTLPAPATLTPPLDRPRPA